MSASMCLGSQDLSLDLTSDRLMNTSHNVKKYEDLRMLLESTKDGHKLEAMKRIVSLMAKGKNVSMLFASVVKSVVCSNFEVKKLVYVYLVRYAEEKQDLALLSISTFQKGLKDSNQLIRASALRILSSIRVPIIIPILVIAIKEASADLSPFVRRVAALATLKLHALESEMKDELVLVIEKLLSDRSSLVLGSAMLAYQHVCPDRVDLIHKNFRHLCSILTDVDEWGQVILLGMLTRYAKSQFVNVSSISTRKPRNAISACVEDGVSVDVEHSSVFSPPRLDTDHRLLLDSAKALLFSMNSAVIIAVTQLYLSLAPPNDISIIVNPLLICLNKSAEIRTLILHTILQLCLAHPSLFNRHLKSFFVLSSDSLSVRILKLRIITSLVDSVNATTVLREFFYVYISSFNKDEEFLSSVVQAIGLIAPKIDSVRDTCVSILVTLMNSENTKVVSESIVVIKQLFQIPDIKSSRILKKMAQILPKLPDSSTFARSSIIWLLGEYCSSIPTIVPDTLRVLLKSFTQEESLVKLQIITLSAKLLIKTSSDNPQISVIKLMYTHAFNLAKYDSDCDVRDRARFLCNLITPHSLNPSADSQGVLDFFANAKGFLLTQKPAPVSNFFESSINNNFLVGTLSHFIGYGVNGYAALPKNPEENLGCDLRQVATAENKSSDGNVIKNSVLESACLSMENESLQSLNKDEYTEIDVDSKRAKHSKDVESNQLDKLASRIDIQRQILEYDEDDSHDDDHTESNDENSDGFGDVLDTDDANYFDTDIDSNNEDAIDSCDNGGNTKNIVNIENPIKEEKVEMKKIESNQQTNLDLLLELEDSFLECTLNESNSSALTPSLTPLLPFPLQDSSLSVLGHNYNNRSVSQNTKLVFAKPYYVSTHHSPLIDRLKGVFYEVLYRFTRKDNIFSPNMVDIEMAFKASFMDCYDEFNTVKDLKIVCGENIKSKVYPIQPIYESLKPNLVVCRNLGIDFSDSCQSIPLSIKSNLNVVSFNISAPIGEQVQPVKINCAEFDTFVEKLKGLNETSEIIVVGKDLSCVTVSDVLSAILTNINAYPILIGAEEKLFLPEVKSIKFSACSKSQNILIFFALFPQFSSLDSFKIVINCEKMIVSSVLIQEVISSLRSLSL